MFVLCIPTIVVLIIYQFIRDKLFAKRMRRLGRFVAWRELEPRLQSGEGTLVIEQAQKDGIRVWWTPDDVIQESPVAPVPERELDYLRIESPHPFVAWCFERYLHPQTGHALLTRPPYWYPAGFVRRRFFTKKFTGVMVVMSVKVA